MGFSKQIGKIVKVVGGSNIAVTELDGISTVNIDGIASGAEVNVQSDWDAASGDSHILNKPTIPTGDIDRVRVTAESGSFTIATGNADFNVNGDSQNIMTTITGTTVTVTQKKFWDVKVHSWYDSDANQVYIPFGPSSVEHSSTSDSLNDDTLFIPPYDGVLLKVMAHSAPGGLIVGGAGSTDIALRVNGTTLTAENETILHETTKTFTWTGNNTFSAGDRLRISFDPTNTPKYSVLTSVWQYTYA